MAGFCDIHTHVLPGVDDGAKNWDICLEMIDRAWEGGVRQIIATPHYLPWQKKENKPEQLIWLCKEAEDKARKELGHPIRIYPGQEIYYHADLEEKLRRGEILTLAGSRYILVECALEIPYRELLQAVMRLRAQSYQPILAHVERYNCLRNPEHLQSIREAGAMLQINVQSVNGGLLDKDTRWCKKQLLDGQIHFIASDMHNLSTRPPMSFEKLQWIGRKLDRDYQKEILQDNALRIGL